MEAKHAIMMTTKQRRFLVTLVASLEDESLCADDTREELIEESQQLLVLEMLERGSA